MKSLLDTCTLAAFPKSSPNVAVIEAVRAIPDADLYLSVLTIGEIAKGIALLATGKKKKALGTWLAALENQFSDRVLGIDVETAKLWAELTARAQKKGIVIPAADGLLAATALRHGLHVMTRNTKHCEASGALVIDPWRES